MEDIIKCFFVHHLLNTRKKIDVLAHKVSKIYAHCWLLTSCRQVQLPWTGAKKDIWATAVVPQTVIHFSSDCAKFGELLETGQHYGGSKKSEGYNRTSPKISCWFLQKTKRTHIRGWFCSPAIRNKYAVVNEILHLLACRCKCKSMFFYCLLWRTEKMQRKTKCLIWCN